MSVYDSTFARALRIKYPMPKQLSSPYVSSLTHLEHINPKKNYNKYYEVAMIFNSTGTPILYTHWGRIGTNGQEKIVIYSSESDLAYHYNQQIEKKRTRGYKAQYIAKPQWAEDAAAFLERSELKKILYPGSISTKKKRGRKPKIQVEINPIATEDIIDQIKKQDNTIPEGYKDLLNRKIDI